VAILASLLGSVGVLPELGDTFAPALAAHCAHARTPSLLPWHPFFDPPPPRSQAIHHVSS